MTYKSALFAYFLFWGVYWPAQDEPNVARYFSFWTWYIATACEWLLAVDGRVKQAKNFVLLIQ